MTAKENQQTKIAINSKLKNNSRYCICGQQHKVVQENESVHHLRVQSSELWETQHDVARLENRVGVRWRGEKDEWKSLVKH